ncbi:MAG: DUF1926 domain-containing protein [Candidatus Omnitrophica bacterium]|nr:DUF1926 domain-containing protein [Candidatus Omnitrophota bacterium]
MSGSVTLLMAVHCHQPVGNFGFVFEEAYTKAYEPFIGVLERHPGVRLALHYSGPLLDWLAAERPAFVARIRRLAARGRVELLAGGYYEPILPLIPEPDRQGQIAMMRQALSRRFRVEAQGLWLTERVWEPELPRSLAAAGIRYTMVDANQFQPAKSWLPAALQVEDEAWWDVLGSYTAEYAGSTVRLFPASKRLRYTMPFQPVDKTIEFLRRLRRQAPVAVTFADDGEKFGLWPKTHDWVYREGWLDRFFSALEREGAWLSTSTFRDYVRQAPPDGRVALPCGSYDEMLEWSNGNFRNFFVKYPEANAMQQAMLRVSESLRALKAQGSRLKAASKRPSAFSLQPSARQRDALLRQAERELYTAQCNCAYWHGVFGGLYLAHLRRAVYSHLIRAEAFINRLAGRSAAVASADQDGDGMEELRVATSAMSLVVDPAEGGTVTAWHLYQPNVNVLDTLSRRPESYHRKLREPQPAAVAASARHPPSIHDALGVKEEQLDEHLVYDDHRRSAFIDYAFESLPSLQEAARSTWGERRLWSSGPWTQHRPAGSNRSLRIELRRALPAGSSWKIIQASPKEPAVEFRYGLEGVRAPVAALEFNVALRDERRLQGPSEQRAVRRFDILEQWSGIRLAAEVDPPATLYTFPVETVSESEGGLERTFQGLCAVLLWELRGLLRWESRVRWAYDPSTRAPASLDSTRDKLAGGLHAPRASARTRSRGRG